MPNEPIDVIERKPVTAKKIQRPQKWLVIFLNDDFTPMEFVVAVLMDYFNKTIEDATQVMIDVHEKGKGIAGVYTYEIAETKVSMTSQAAKKNEFPLRCVMEPAPDESE